MLRVRACMRVRHAAKRLHTVRHEQHESTRPVTRFRTFRVVSTAAGVIDTWPIRLIWTFEESPDEIETQYGGRNARSVLVWSAVSVFSVQISDRLAYTPTRVRVCVYIYLFIWCKRVRLGWYNLLRIGRADTRGVRLG